MTASPERPSDPETALLALRAEAMGWQACPLWKDAVFGEGPVPAALMLVGEQPGDMGALITVHPSSLLRMPEPDRKEEDYRCFVDDLRLALATVTTHDP